MTQFDARSILSITLSTRDGYCSERNRLASKSSTSALKASCPKAAGCTRCSGGPFREKFLGHSTGCPISSISLGVVKNRFTFWYPSHSGRWQHPKRGESPAFAARTLRGSSLAPKVARLSLSTHDARFQSPHRFASRILRLLLAVGCQFDLHKLWLLAVCLHNLPFANSLPD